MPDRALDMLIHRWLIGDYRDEAELAGMLEAIGWSPERPRFQCICMRLDHSASVRRELGYSHVTERSARLLDALNQPEEGMFACIESSSVLAVIVCTQSFLTNDEIYERAKGIQGKVNGGEGISMTVGIGTRSPSAALVRESWRNAWIASRYRMVYGWGQIIDYESIVSRVGVTPPYPEAIFRSVVQAFTRGDASAFENQLSLLMTAAYTQSFVFGQALMRQISAELYRNIPPQRQVTCDFVQMSCDLDECETMDEQFSLLSGFYLAQMTGAASSEKHEEQLKQILAFIEARLADPDLSMTAIAEFAKISQSSVRNIFRQNDLPAPKEYVQGLRMEKACSLLRETDLTAREISEQVGFLQSRYFYAAFKKQTGMTAFEYRTRAKNGQL